MAYRSWSDGDGEQVAGWVRSEMKDVFSGASILLVEDDDDIRELMSTLLRLAGFEPTVCSSAEVALEQLREQPFDLVLTDYALPNRSGGWLLQQARAEGLLDATPALVVTAHPNPPDVEGYEVICKPFDLDDLVTRVKRRLEQRAETPAADVVLTLEALRRSWRQRLSRPGGADPLRQRGLAGVRGCDRQHQASARTLRIGACQADHLRSRHRARTPVQQMRWRSRLR